MFARLKVLDFAEFMTKLHKILSPFILHILISKGFLKKRQSQQSCGSGDVNVGLSLYCSVGPPLWSRLKQLKNCWNEYFKFFNTGLCNCANHYHHGIEQCISILCTPSVHVERVTKSQRWQVVLTYYVVNNIACIT